MVKPSSAARSRIKARLSLNCSGVDPYFCATCSTSLCPSAGMCGLSSNGWKRMSASKVANPLERLLDPFEADDAPRAGNIRNEVDRDGLGHRGTGNWLG